MNIPAKFGIILTSIENLECKIEKLKPRNQAFLASNVEIRDTRYEIRDKSVIFNHKCQSFKHLGVLMDKKHLFSRLHKWGIANDPAVVAERFTEACFVERFGRRRQTHPKTFLPHEIAQRYLLGVISVAKNLFTPLETCFCFLMGCNPWLINDLRLRKITYETITFFCKTNPNSEKVK